MREVFLGVVCVSRVRWVSRIKVEMVGEGSASPTSLRGEYLACAGVANNELFASFGYLGLAMNSSPER